MKNDVKMLISILVLSFAGTVLSTPVLDFSIPKIRAKCGYESCTKPHPGKLNVHLVPHTHDDVGWLKTVDQYYYGSQNNIQKAGVQYILDSVVKELWTNPDRRFIYVETAFFWKWWTQQSRIVKLKVHALVRQGRLKFVGGAWSMNDEASTHYQSLIDQFTFGLKKLKDTFGECGRPRVGWQIDPFGHSKEFASIMAGMGYDGLFLGRIDYMDKDIRMKNKSMEMIWRGDDVLGASSDIFTGVLYNRYSPPPGFCYDLLCNDEPIVDDPTSPLYNVDSKVNDFLEYCRTMSQSYLTDNIILTMGDDFQYQDASIWFKNLDKLIKYTNLKAAKDGLNVTLFYSTPDCYLKAVKDSNPVLPTKHDDFFPYASDPTAYWTGYFTSRPTTKYFEREGNNYLQVAKQLQVLTNLGKRNDEILDELRSAVGVMQHHDAITGTEKQHVTHDYERILNSGIESSLVIPRQAINKMTQHNSKFNNIGSLNMERCRLNESSCHTSEHNNNFVVTVYNPLVWEVTEAFRIPVKVKQHDTYRVYDPKGKQITSQMIEIQDNILKLPTRRSAANYEVVFVDKIKPLAYKSYYLSKTDLKNEIDEINNINNMMLSDQPIVEVDEDYKNNQPLEATVQDDGYITYKLPTNNIDIGIFYYPGCVGDNRDYDSRSSGAYIFRPNSTEAFKTTYTYDKLIRGAVVDEVRYLVDDAGSITYRIYHEGLMEVDFVIGPINITDNVGKEYIVRYKTNSEEKGFYTDSNSRQFVKRYNRELRESISGNYYPVNMAYIDDRFAVISDRPEGGRSFNSDNNNNEVNLEFMLHRRLLHDDAFGVGEALNETINQIGLITRITHRNLLNSNNIRKKSLELNLKPTIFVSNANFEVRKWLEMTNEYSWLKNINKDVHLLTLEAWNDNLMIRVENINEINDVTVDLDMFKSIKIVDYKETMLAGNVWKENEHSKREKDFKIQLKPQQIRTFIVKYKYIDV